MAAPSTSIWDGAAWRTAIGFSAYDGAAWRTAKNAWAYDGVVWLMCYTTANLTGFSGDCVAYGNTTSGLFDVSWTTTGDLASWTVTLEWRIGSGGTYATLITGLSSTTGTVYSGNASVFAGWAGDMNPAATGVYIRATLVHTSGRASPGSPRSKGPTWLA